MHRGLKAFTITILLASAAASFAAAERHIVIDDCVVSGCQNEHCSAPGDATTPTSCMDTDAPHCYELAGECKRQPDNKCSWTPSQALDKCLLHGAAALTK